MLMIVSVTGIPIGPFQGLLPEVLVLQGSAGNSDASLLENISTDHLNGGPWVMWPDTPYRHLMIPIDSR